MFGSNSTDTLLNIPFDEMCSALVGFRFLDTHTDI